MSSGLSGIGFVGCELHSAAPGDGQRSGGSAPHSHAKRREVVVNGTRVKTVDVHAHCAVPEAMAHARQGAASIGRTIGGDFLNSSLVNIALLEPGEAVDSNRVKRLIGPNVMASVYCIER